MACSTPSPSALPLPGAHWVLSRLKVWRCLKDVAQRQSGSVARHTFRNVRYLAADKVAWCSVQRIANRAGDLCRAGIIEDAIAGPEYSLLIRAVGKADTWSKVQFRRREVALRDARGNARKLQDAAATRGAVDRTA